jgi:hypothetical protein
VPHAVEVDFGVWVQVLVPLHAESMHVVEVQVIAVPVQVLPEQASLNVQRLPSSQPGLERQAQVPPALVQRQVVPPQLTAWHMLWLVALQVYSDPPEHSPAAPAGPQPVQPWPTVSWFAAQVSAQVPLVVRQPPRSSSQPAWQHWFPPPTPQVLGVAVHEQLLQTSPVPLQ